MNAANLARYMSLLVYLACEPADICLVVCTQLLLKRSRLSSNKISRGEPERLFGFAAEDRLIHMSRLHALRVQILDIP